MAIRRYLVAKMDIKKREIFKKRGNMHTSRDFFKRVLITTEQKRGSDDKQLDF